MSGAEQMAKEILERLGDRYELILITGRYDKKLPKFENRPNFKLIRVGVGHKKFDKLFYPFFSSLLVRKIKPQICHAIMESYAGVALALVKYFYPRAKRILTLQSGDLDDRKKQSQWQIRVFWQIIHRSPHLITAISNFLAERAKRLGVLEKNIIITPNGVDLAEVPEKIEAITNRVICVARLSWEKGIDYLLKAWPEVLAKTNQTKLVLVGEGNKRAEIEELIRKLNIADSVELKGNLSHRQTLLEIKKSEVFICPSLAEGLGIVFIEAQACGVAAIGTRVGGIPDIIIDGQTGLLVEPKDSSAIAKALIQLLTDKESARKLAERASLSVKKFAWPNIMEQINNIYQNINKAN